MNTNQSIRRISVALLLAVSFGSAASARSILTDPPAWAASMRSDQEACTTAAKEAKQLAIEQGISPDRMQWLYGRKPFEKIGHVSLVIDGWIVVDNGGLGHNMWGDAICRDNVCTLKDARRGLEESFLENATVAVREEIGTGNWAMRVAAKPD